MSNDEVNAPEVIDRLYDIIHMDSLIGDANGVCLEDISCLVTGQSAALDMV